MGDALNRMRALATRHQGAPGRLPRGFFGRPRGYVDWPEPGAELARAPTSVIGWCLFPGSSVARVELSVGGGPPERARIAMERADIPGSSVHTDAPICAFEHKVDLDALPPDVRSVRIEAVAHALDGRRLALDPVEFALAEPEPDVEAGGARATELRARSVAPVRPRLPGARLRLLAYTHMLVYGGGSLYLYELLRRLVHDHGVDCELVSLADGPLLDAFEDAGVPVHVTDGFPVTSIERYEGHVAELTAWAAGRGFDAALVNTLGSFTGGDLAARLGIPAVWAVHESFPLPMFWHTAYAPGALHPYPRAQGEQAFRSAAAVLFEAEATRELFLPHADADRLLTLPYGIELDELDAARDALRGDDTRRRLGIDAGAQVVLCLGSVEPRKSQAMLAAAFAQVAARHPRAQLVLVGENDAAYCADYRAALREFVSRAGLERRVRIEPTTTDPYSWHAVADVLVCSSDVESLPRVIMEAMAFGTPVLSTRVFGVPELIDDGETGYLCEMRDLASLAEGLDRVLGAGSEELQAVARAATAHVRARHDPSRYAGQVATLLRGLVGDPAALPAGLLDGRQRQPLTQSAAPPPGSSGTRSGCPPRSASR